MKEKITEKGYELLTRHLKQLVDLERGKVQKEIDAARKFCDFGEDSTFRQLVEERFKLDRRIEKLEKLLAQAEIIEPDSLAKDRISFGSTVRLIQLESNEEESFTIGHPAELSVRDDLISIESPLAKQLLGKKPGDLVSLSGEENFFKIVEVS